MMKTISTWITTVMLLGLLAGCSVTPKHSTEVVMLPKANSAHDFMPSSTEKLSETLNRTLLEQYHEWQGTRYQAGGMSKNGVDCSGYVHLTFKERLGLDVPRNSTALSQIGTPIGKPELRTGDLVFFHTGRTRHVGIYLDDNRFMHASSRKGVMISSLDKGYWANRWWTARRVEPDYLYLLANL